MDQQPQFQQPQFQQRPQLPNATATLVLGICSIVGCFCYGVVGIICGVIALVISREGVQMHKADPGAYAGWQNMNAGRICAFIGIGLSLLYLILVVFIGTQMPWQEIMEQARENQ
jgi:M penetrans paralogue family 26